jgi:xanthine dehydrogenase accessory factor
VPAGLDLGHTTHREVAVSVLAELVRRRAAGELPTSSGVAVEPAAEAIDPVCGMTVAADESGRPFEHEDVTYYFCCSGCRRSFEGDPAQYLSQEATC